MKALYTILLMITILALMAFQTTNFTEGGMVKGKVTSISGEELIGVSVYLVDKSVGTVTDVDGNYSLKMGNGKHNLLFSYIGYTTKMKEVEVRSGKTIILDIQLEESGETLDEVMTLEWTAPVVKEDVVITKPASSRVARKKSKDVSSAVTVTGSRGAFTTSDSSPSSSVVMERATTKSVRSKEHMAAVGVEIEREAKVIKDLSYKKIEVKDSYFATESFLLDGEVVSKNLIPLAKLNALEVIAMKKIVVEKPKKKERPKAGQLTAGEWRDQDHWKDWKKQQTKENEFVQAKKDWEMNFDNRYAIVVENKEGQPLANVEVLLKDAKNELLWTAQTDNAGKVFLWDTKNKEEGNSKKRKLKVTLNYQGKKHQIKLNASKANKKIKTIKIKTECNISNQIDIMFAVDATGSMGDEINYLKSELQDVIERVQESDDVLDIRLGTVFYRDHSDAYLTQSSPLDRDIQKTIDFIKNQKADGGGDFPEAVDAALEVAIGQQDWNEDALAKIVFLVLDAPPHMGKQNIASLHNSIRLAAKKGIKIIPITASGINRSTEYLMKNMALATNGTYVFITDDSGIGSSHLAPSNKDYKVELLNDLMVRLIGEYSDRTACEEEEPELKQFQFANDPNQNGSSSTVVFKDDPSLLNKVKYFPNPATTEVTIQLQEVISEISIIHSNGQVVKRLENVQAGSTEVDLTGLSEGFYLIRFKKDKSVASGKLIVISLK